MYMFKVRMSDLRRFTGLSMWVRVLVVFVLLWGLLVLLFASKLNTPTTASNGNEYTMKRLNQVIDYLEQSKKRNDELKLLIDEYLK